jgi:hypothetical protein
LVATAHGFSAEVAPPPDDKRAAAAAPDSSFVRAAHLHAKGTVYVHTPTSQPLKTCPVFREKQRPSEKQQRYRKNLGS